ncbi:fumarylacetoacetate hydrolase family protein [Tabrizicola sp.]|uniref:fumarylacetoacetate hydrolase family protein n=1 Tax=Tabrizicola sp. TaxID=2005166 RepID=UPI00262C2F2B|nr:fumarylacetoacetate hydrolase family protein [Tabrizicola sp.]MDM7933273.1 fumarylacetoacetate hydrolase family protein [Tabrizicola sp.]
MVALVFPAFPTVTLPVTGRPERFPVRRIFCVGRNYDEHTREMGGEPGTEPPFFFTKPADAVVESGSRIPYPTATANLHHEAELVIAIGKSGAMVTEADAPAMIWGHAAGNDLTRRDLQAEAKAARRPWDMAKGFDKSAVLGAIRPGPMPDASLRCTVNGALRQEARLSDMIWSPAAIIAALSQLVSLSPGDLIFTGTPAGVGPLKRGDTCKVEIDGLQSATVTIA